ncbi:hypothetical protein BC828DRAFT_374056 [Blastocladiella britannica]|nr:hypothetical protein BC828DRAFT_374056 [Blastocladiella britannica]
MLSTAAHPHIDPRAAPHKSPKALQTAPALPIFTTSSGQLARPLVASGADTVPAFAPVDASRDASAVIAMTGARGTMSDEQGAPASSSGGAALVEKIMQVLAAAAPQALSAADIRARVPEIYGGEAPAAADVAAELARMLLWPKVVLQTIEPAAVAAAEAPKKQQADRDLMRLGTRAAASASILRVGQIICISGGEDKFHGPAEYRFAPIWCEEVPGHE